MKKLSLAVVLLLTCVHLRAQGDLQALIDAAPPGSTLTVAPGNYGPIVVAKNLTIQTSGTLPFRRVLGTDDPNQFIRIAATNAPAVQIQSAAVTLIGFKVTRTDNPAPIIAINGDWTMGTTTLDRVWVVGDALVSNHRGVEANGWATTIIRSRIENIFNQSDDAQAVCSWTGPGPLTIDDSYLEASTETVLIGGADPINQAHQPHNFTLRNSYLTKRVAWQQLPGSVKNTLELKDVIGFTITDNVIEYTWADAQSGYILVLTPRNQDGHAPYSNVTDGYIARNLFRHSAAGVNILGTDDQAPSGTMTNVRLTNNRFEDVNPSMWGNGDGRLVQIQLGPVGLTMDHNSFVGTNLNSFLYFAPYLPHSPLGCFRYTNNYATEGFYGLFGDNLGSGQPPVLDYYAPGWSWSRVALLHQSPDTITYPPDTIIVPDEATALAMGIGAVGYPTGQ